MTRTTVVRVLDRAISIRISESTRTVTAGTFFLARSENGNALTRSWETYLRRPFFPTHIESTPEATILTFYLPAGDDPGYAWLRDRIPEETIDLLGPFGKGFTLDSAKPNLLLAADADLAPLLMPLQESALDRGGRVTLLLRAEDSPTNEDTPTNIESADRAIADPAPSPSTTETLLTHLPFAVEARVEAPAGFANALRELLPWCDQFCALFPREEYAALAQLVKRVRMRPLPRFAQALVLTDYPCGVGACLACIVPLARGGHTRACVHGPVFDLLELG